mgnify:CR=1 FL=1
MASNYRNSPNTVCRNISMPLDDYELFSRLYPHMLTKYVQRCIRLAVCDKSFFDSVFFRPVCSEFVKLSEE